jgi:DNA-binding CsgD family transcriptional regulator
VGLLTDFSDASRTPEPRSFGPNADTHQFTQPPVPLPITGRQLQCLAWVQEGKSASDIGVILGISGRTVEHHIMKVCGALGVKTRVQAVIKARDLGLFGPTSP